MIQNLAEVDLCFGFDLGEVVEELGDRGSPFLQRMMFANVVGHVQEGAEIPADAEMEMRVGTRRSEDEASEPDEEAKE